jgi:hypothetical protein
MNNAYNIIFAAALAGCASGGGKPELLGKIYDESVLGKYSVNVYNNPDYYIVGNGECRLSRPERRDVEKILRYMADKNIAYDYGEEDGKGTYTGMKKVEDAFSENGIKASVKSTRVHDDMVYFTVSYDDAQDRNKIDLVLLNKFGSEYMLGRVHRERESEDRAIEKRVCRYMALSDAAHDAKEKAREIGVSLKYPVKISENGDGGKISVMVMYYFE